MSDRSQILNDPEETMRIVLESSQIKLWTALPATVTKVNFAKMTCECQPTIQAVVADQDGNRSTVDMPLLLDVPIVFPSAGGFTITLPLAINDEVLVIFSSRCIDAWWQSGGVQQAMEARMHDLSDGFAIPGPKSLPNVISSISSTGAQIRNNSGSTYVEISADGKIKLVTGSEVAITGNLKVSGNITAQGNVTATLGDVKAGPLGISLQLHTHISNTPGNPTGPALP